VIMYLYVRSTSQESGWSCICMLGVQSLPVPSQESERSCICMLGVQARGVSGTSNIQIHDHSLAWLVLLTHKYMTTHSPVLYS
jgi:hypothetical protein